MKSLIFSVFFFTLAVCAAHAQAPLRNGDTFEIRLSGVPPEDATAYSAPYTIDDQGMINLPYINQVKVAGLLPNEIQDLIQKRLVEQKIFTHPTVVIMENSMRFVNVAGEVRSPTRVGFTPDMTLLSALNAAGWFTDYADQKHIHLTRDGKTTNYDIRQIRKDPSTDPKLLPGDQIVVPQSWF